MVPTAALVVATAPGGDVLSIATCATRSTIRCTTIYADTNGESGAAAAAARAAAAAANVVTVESGCPPSFTAGGGVEFFVSASAAWGLSATRGTHCCWFRRGVLQEEQLARHDVAWRQDTRAGWGSRVCRGFMFRIVPCYGFFSPVVAHSHTGNLLVGGIRRRHSGKIYLLKSLLLLLLLTDSSLASRYLSRWWRFCLRLMTPWIFLAACCFCRSRSLNHERARFCDQQRRASA